MILSKLFKKKEKIKKPVIINIKELSECPGNCYSCGYLRKFVPCGHFECNFYNPQGGDAILCDTNAPYQTNCIHWKEKRGRRVLTSFGEFAGLENY
jgi:hypothetical protein